MLTNAQKKANRKNARKSTGPKTPEGKEKSSQNAVKHGFFTQQDVIKYESQVDYDMLRHEILEDLNPIGPIQYRLADRIVSLSWRLKRIERIHNQTIDIMIEKDALKYKDKYRRSIADPYEVDPDLALGRIAIKDFSNYKVLERLTLYERRMENSLYKTINELKKLQNTKNGPRVTSHESRINMQNKPNSPSRIEYQESCIENMKNKPNLYDQMNVSEVITKDYENEILCGSPQKTINHPRPRADSTNIEDPPMVESIIN